MPYLLIKTNKCWKVANAETGKLHAKCTTQKKAEAQLRLLTDYESKKGGAIPPEILEKAREKYYLAKAMKQIEKQIPEVDRPQLLPDYERLQRPVPKPKKKKVLVGKTKRKRIIRGTGSMMEIDDEDEGGYLESFKRTAGVLPPPVRKMLEKIGTEPITSLQIVRTPLSRFVTTLMNIVSLGAYSQAVKDSPYDAMFHLAMRINGKYTTDKQEVIKLNTTNPVKKDSQTLDIPVSKTVGIQEMFDKGKEFMGDEKFTGYDARTNNCQDFILGLLKGSGLSTSQAESFIKQDPEVVFEKIPSVSQKVSRLLTDVGAVAERIVEGEGVEKKKGGWKAYMSRQMKGKKFKSRQEVNDFVKELSRKYKK